MGILFGKQDFIPLVSYTFSMLNRVNRELNLAEELMVLKNITLIGIKIGKMDDSILKAMAESSRTSDAFFMFDGLFVGLLFGTDKEGAIHILNQLREFFGENMGYTIATSPEDGQNPSELIESFRSLVNIKMGIDIYNL